MKMAAFWDFAPRSYLSRATITAMLMEAASTSETSINFNRL
jgi:hypothetical protein